MPLEKDRGMKALLDMDQQFKKIMGEVVDTAFKMVVGHPGTRSNKEQQVILNNFRKQWRTQRKFDDLQDSTKEKKENANPPQDFILVASGKLGRDVRNTIKTRIVGNKITATVTVPDYGVYIQNGTLNMDAREFFSLKGYENIFFGLIESLLTLEFNKLGIRAKEL